MIIKGSLNYDQFGRKRKRKSSAGRSSSGTRTAPFQGANAGSSPARPTKKKTIPSAPVGEYKPPRDTSWKVEASRKYTVAPAYNKGAYQVIPREDIKHIGK